MIHKACKWCKSDLPRSCLCPILWFAAVRVVPAIASYFARQHADHCDRVQCLPVNSTCHYHVRNLSDPTAENATRHYPVRNLSAPTAETSTCGYPVWNLSDPTAENATRHYPVRNLSAPTAETSTCGYPVWNLSDPLLRMPLATILPVRGMSLIPWLVVLPLATTRC